MTTPIRGRIENRLEPIEGGASSEATSMLLEWTGHPMVDAAIATVCAFADRSGPSGVEIEDLDRLAGWLAENYFSDSLASRLRGAFHNSAYVNPAAGEARKRAWIHDVLGAHRAEPDSRVRGLRCAFSAAPATRLANRQHVPLLTAEGVPNFFPALRTGLPIAGPYLVALQALPLGGLFVAGGLLVAASDEPRLTLRIARRHLDANRLRLSLGEWEETRSHRPLARLCEELVDLFGETFPGPGTSLVALHFSSAGQKPFVAVHALPSGFVRFLARISRDPFAPLWKAAIRPRHRVAARGDRGPSPYQDLASIFQAGPVDLSRAATFVRRHLISSAGCQSELWPVVHLFLEELLAMDRSKIDSIRRFADRVADHIVSLGLGGKRLFGALRDARSEAAFRSALVRAQLRSATGDAPTPVIFDEFCRAFEEDDVTGRYAARLAQDLSLLRIVERLRESGWFMAEGSEEVARVERAENGSIDEEDADETEETAEARGDL